MRKLKLLALVLTLLAPAPVEPLRGAVLAPPSSFVPIASCRIADTRQGEGKTGPFGPPTPAAGSVRTFPVLQAGCGIPAGATAYSLNVTVVPQGPLSFLSVYPTGQGLPNVSTLNSFDGAILANAAIVPAGTGGSIDIYVTDRADYIVDIGGYFVSSGPAAKFYLVSSCRILDTRVGEGKTGPFGPPTLIAGISRDIPVPSAGCNIPSGARAYVLNITVVPRGALSYLVAWPTGSPRPLASTLNSLQGRIVANAALIPAGTDGAISIYATQSTDVIVDITGYVI